MRNKRTQQNKHINFTIIHKKLNYILKLTYLKHSIIYLCYNSLFTLGEIMFHNEVYIDGIISSQIVVPYSTDKIASFTLCFVTSRFSKSILNKIKITLLGRKAIDSFREHCNKGDKVGIKGSLSINIWKDSKGNRHKDATIIMRSFIYFEKGEPIEVIPHPKPTTSTQRTNDEKLF